MPSCVFFGLGFLGDARKTLENKGESARENRRENRLARWFSSAEPVAAPERGQKLNGQSDRAWRISSDGQGKCPIYIGRLRTRSGERADEKRIVRYMREDL